MKKFFLAIFACLLISTTANAQDIWFYTEHSPDGETTEHFLKPETVKEYSGRYMFDAAIVNVYKHANGTVDETRRVYSFVRVKDIWYVTRLASTTDWKPLSEFPVLSKFFDTCKPYSHYAKMYPR